MVEQALREAAAVALDDALFSTAAETEAAAAGLLYGITPVVPATGSPDENMITDLKALIGQVTRQRRRQSDRDHRRARQAASIKLRAPAGFSYQSRQAAR
jgi:hypothetical protein